MEIKNQSSIDPVDITSTKTILNQMINCICKIKYKNGIGFFCKIPLYNNIMNFLMTNYNIINEDYFKENKEIELILNDDIIKIDMNNKRKIYYNKEYNITLIELKEEDKIKEYIELDDYNEIYENKSIYILGYPNKNNICVTYGILNKINNNNNIICNIDNISLGSPILNLKNNKLIGINIFNNKNILLKDILNDIINNNKFTFIKELGEGGFGKVNLVLNNIDNKYYALKEIEIKKVDNINILKNEINNLSKFNCNNIIKYHDSYKINDKYYILMEYCDGNNLKDFINKYIKNNELIEENILYNIIKQICIGIKEMHKMKRICIDLKP